MTLPDSILDMLDHGCDGEPRWVVLDARDAQAAVDLVAAIAAESERRGYVPLAVERLPAYVESVADDARRRTLVLLQTQAAGTREDGAPLVTAAGLNARPHVLVTIAVGRRPRAGALLVREASTVYTAGPRAAVCSPEWAHYRARAHDAFALARRGRHAPAVRMLREVAAALDRRRDVHGAAAATVLLGRVLLERGRSDGAAAAFNEAVRMLDPVAPSDAASARIWVALARTDAGRLTEAEGLLRAARLAEALPPGSARRWADAALARCLLWQDRAAEAAQLLDGVPVIEDDGDAQTAVRLLAIDARARVALGRPFEAGQRARAALEWAARTDDALLRLTAALTHLRVLATTGDLELARATKRDVLAAAREAHAPLYALRARVVWAEMLRRGGRQADAARELRVCGRVAAAAPELLRRHLQRVAREPNRASEATPWPDGGFAVALLRLVQDEEDDREAVHKALHRVCDHLRAGRVEVQSAAAGPLTAIASAGTGLPSRLGQRALEAGIVIGPEQRDGVWQAAAPVRSAHRVLGVVTCRWPLGRDALADAGGVLELAATVVAPRLDNLLAARAEAAQATLAVPELIGDSAPMADVRRTIARAATAPFAVLIEGESGAGKELVARAIHHLSPRRDRRFCDVNCAALPDDLVEAELFGHARGAFTGALVERKGLFEEASGGTLFLDELPDLSLRSQAKLLRAVQHGEIRRVGESFTRRVDVRVVTATNRSMADEVAAGRFRQDLLYRLDVLRISVPPLRDRLTDIPPLAQHFFAAAAQRTGTRATLSHAVLAELARYHWPGNVRELQNVMAALAVAAPARGVVRASLLPPAITGAISVSSGRLVDARRQFERRFIEVALARAGGSRTKAAAQLGVSRQGLLKLMERLGLNAGGRPDAA